MPTLDERVRALDGAIAALRDYRRDNPRPDPVAAVRLRRLVRTRDRLAGIIARRELRYGAN